MKIHELRAIIRRYGNVSAADAAKLYSAIEEVKNEFNHTLECNKMRGKISKG